MTVDEIRKIVHEAMDNAVVNGHLELMMSDDAYKVAADLTDCCGDLEGIDKRKIVPHVETWQEARE